MNRLYNEEIKEKFLSTYDNEQTQKTLRNVFQNSALIENVLEKDIYDFTLDELGKIIENTNPHTKNVARSTGRFISQYISWAIEPPQRLRKNALNPLKGVLQEWYDNFVDKTKKIHYSYDEFIDLLEDNQMMNGQDQAFLFLIFEGIVGEKFSQIKELKFSDIDWDTNEVFVKERNEKIKVSEDCIKYLQKAYNQSTYYQFNSNTKEFNEKELLSSEFIFKNVKSPRGQENEPVKINVFYKRIQSLKEIFSLEYLTPNGIKQSGMIKMAVDIFKRDGELAYDQLAEIGEKYAYSKLVNNGYEYYNTYLMKEFVNEENIKELYDIDLEIKLR
jgi:integrase